MTVLTDTQWVRRLLEDDPVTEYETSTASGTEFVFYVQNPPITSVTSVKVNSVPQTVVTDYTASANAITLVAIPAANANIEITYVRQTFSDDELETFLAASNDVWTYSRNRVYQAAIYAIDALLVGAATALNFGVGQENFDMVSVFERLKSLRAMYAEFLEMESESGVDGDMGAALVIQDMVFDAYDPGPPDPPLLPETFR